MADYSASWEDEENNRIVELSVEYQLDQDEFEISDITPVSVTFLNPGSKIASRTIRIWTDTGRRVLARAYQEKVGLEQLKRELQDSLLLTP